MCDGPIDQNNLWLFVIKNWFRYILKFYDLFVIIKAELLIESVYYFSI